MRCTCELVGSGCQACGHLYQIIEANLQTRAVGKGCRSRTLDDHELLLPEVLTDSDRQPASTLENVWAAILERIWTDEISHVDFDSIRFK